MYIDPGSGTLLWQMVYAVILGGTYFVRGTIFGLFRKLRNVWNRQPRNIQKENSLD